MAILPRAILYSQAKDTHSFSSDRNRCAALSCLSFHLSDEVLSL